MYCRSGDTTSRTKKVTRIRRFHVKLYRHVSQPYSHIVISRMEKGLYCQQTWSDWDWLHSAVDRFMSGRCFAIELTASFGRWQFFNVKHRKTCDLYGFACGHMTGSGDLIGGWHYWLPCKRERWERRWGTDSDLHWVEFISTKMRLMRYV